MSKRCGRIAAIPPLGRSVVDWPSLDQPDEVLRGLSPALRIRSPADCARDCANPLRPGRVQGPPRHSSPATTVMAAEIGPVPGVSFDWANLWRQHVEAMRSDGSNTSTGSQRSRLAQSGSTRRSVAGTQSRVKDTKSCGLAQSAGERALQRWSWQRRYTCSWLHPPRRLHFRIWVEYGIIVSTRSK